MTKLRKIFASSVMVMTVVVMSGLTAPMATKAAAQTGDLIKRDGHSAVYYLKDGKRYVFPNEATYKSWYSDFSGVVTISDDELASYPLAANVVVRPGTKLVKITTDPKVYAVEANGVLRWVQTAADAKALYGDNWEQRVIDVADSFFINYTIGSPLASGEVPMGSLVKKAGESNIYYYDGSDYRLIEDEVAFKANRFQFDNVLTINNFTPSGSDITGSETDIINVAQNISGDTVRPDQGSGVTVALSSATPASMAVPNVASRIPFTTLNLTASNDGTAYVDSITVKRIGLSDDDFKVFAEKNGVKLNTSAKKLNSSDEATLVFSPILTIPAGQTVSVDILVEALSTTPKVAGNSALGIASASAVSASGATVSGSFPIMGNLMSFTDYTVAELKMELKDSSLDVKVGDENILLGELKVSNINRDVILTNVELKNNGSEDLIETISNIRLERDGNIVSNAATYNGKYINFTFPGNGLELLKENGDATLKIKGDVIAKYEATTPSVIFQLDKNTKVFSGNIGKEKSTGFGVSFADTNATSEVNIESGEITIARTQNSPLGEYSYIYGTKNILALEAKIKTEKDIEVEELTIDLNGSLSATSTAIRKVTVKMDNTTIGDFEDDDLDSPTLKLENFDVNKGEHVISIYVDIIDDSDISTGDIKFDIKGDSVKIIFKDSDIVKTGIDGNVSGAKIKIVKTAKISVSKAGTTAEGIILADNTEREIAKFKIHSAGDESNITELVFLATATSTITNERLQDIKVYSGTTLLGSDAKFNNDGKFETSTIKINNDKLKIAAGQTKEIVVKGLFNSNYGEDAVASNTIQLQLNSINASTTIAAALPVDFNIMKVHKIYPKFTFKKGLIDGEGEGPDQQYLEFDVSAEGTGVLSITSLDFRVNGTTTPVNSDIYINDSNTTSSESYANGMKFSLVDGNENLAQIEAGQTKTFKLKANTDAFAGVNFKISVNLNANGVTWDEGTSNFEEFAGGFDGFGLNKFPIGSGYYQNY
ncbi:MAG: hypothetical protein ACOXZ1_02810 [Patescibacteria group bacterium]